MVAQVGIEVCKEMKEMDGDRFEFKKHGGFSIEKELLL